VPGVTEFKFQYLLVDLPVNSRPGVTARLVTSESARVGEALRLLHLLGSPSDSDSETGSSPKFVSCWNVIFKFSNIIRVKDSTLRLERTGSGKPCSGSGEGVASGEGVRGRERAGSGEGVASDSGGVSCGFAAG
jgi:hypothetical protein